jgi:hypothetical protein
MPSCSRQYWGPVRSFLDLGRFRVDPSGSGAAVVRGLAVANRGDTMQTLERLGVLRTALARTGDDLKACGFVRTLGYLSSV